MKRNGLLVVAALMLATTMTFAQKVDADGITSKLEKADADSQNEKKATKAATWIARGDAYLNALTAPAKVMYLGMDAASLAMFVGAAEPSGEKTVGGRQLFIYEYPYLTVYVGDSKVVSWETKKEIYPDAYSEILTSYEKGAALDPKMAEKAKAGLESLIDYYKMQGDLALALSNMKAGAEAYDKVAEIEANPAYNKVDPTSLFYAGYMYTMDGDNNTDSFVKGEQALLKAIDAGYPALEDADTTMADSNRGNLYYYLFHCAYGQKDQNADKIQAAKEYLQTGLTNYPKNEKIFEGLLQLYTTQEGVGDPKELLGTVEANIAANPDDINTWFGRGRIYFALKNYDECIASFEKVIELDPTMFEGQYYLALFWMLKGDDFLQEMNETSYTDQASYDVDIAKLSSFYANSIPIFEKAHEIKPDDASTIEYLKQLCFRLREEPGIMDKYTKYNTLFNAL